MGTDPFKSSSLTFCLGERRRNQTYQALFQISDKTNRNKKYCAPRGKREAKRRKTRVSTLVFFSPLRRSVPLPGANCRQSNLMTRKDPETCKMGTLSFLPGLLLKNNCPVLFLQCDDMEKERRAREKSRSRQLGDI